jgi:hypothetical protein
MARVAPADGLLLASLALIPLWIALEIFFEVVVETLGALGKSARTSAICGLLSGFYITWFALPAVTS